MDPSPKKFPLLSYVMANMNDGSRSPSPEFDAEHPRPTPASTSGSEPYHEVAEHMPYLRDPDLVASMRGAIADVARTRSVLKTLGERPDHESVNIARKRLAEIEESLFNQLDEIPLTGKAAAAEERRKKAEERQRQSYKALISLYEMYQSYDKMMSEAEKRLEKLYEAAKEGGKPIPVVKDRRSGVVPIVDDDVKDELVAILKDALVKGVDRIDLSDKRLPFVPEALGKIRTLVSLKLSSNQLEILPDSISGLEILEELNVSANHLRSLPDSIGLLLKLKILDISSNKLSSLPDGICQCRSLVELDASFNKLKNIPANIGHKLVNLKKLSIPLNKIRSLPPSIGEMKSLQFLDAHFNELRVVPSSIGQLSKLEILNLSGNFNDLTILPYTIGDLTSLKELDLSNNQIHELPITLGRLESLTKLNVDENPLVSPPKKVVKEGVEAVKEYMAKKWFDILVEEEENESYAENEEEGDWFVRGASWFTSTVGNAAGAVGGYLGVSGDRDLDPYLNQQL